MSGDEEKLTKTIFNLLRKDTDSLEELISDLSKKLDLTPDQQERILRESLEAEATAEKERKLRDREARELSDKNARELSDKNARELIEEEEKEKQLQIKKQSSSKKSEKTKGRQSQTMPEKNVSTADTTKLSDSMKQSKKLETQPEQNVSTSKSTKPSNSKKKLEDVSTSQQITRPSNSKNKLETVAAEKDVSTSQTTILSDMKKPNKKQSKKLEKIEASLSLLNIHAQEVVKHLSDDDKEILAYFLADQFTDPEITKQKHGTLLGCKCFDCYKVYLEMWGKSECSELIAEIIDVYEKERM